VVDDVHWSDVPSLRFLTYLARRLEGLDVVVGVAMRTAEAGTDPRLVGELADHPHAVRLRPGYLGEASVAELIRSTLGHDPDPAFTAACVEATGGNPLLVRELLHALALDGAAPEREQARLVTDLAPRAVSQTVLRRLWRLPGDAAAVAQAVAVLGDGVDLSLVAAVAELDEEAVAAAAVALARAEILRPQPPLAFVHPLVRDAVYHALPPGERELRHGRAAQLLLKAQAPVERVAAQLVPAPRRGEEWVIDVLQQAASVASAKGAAEGAVAYLSRAVEEPPPPERRTRLLLALGLAETLTSAPAAADHLREAWEALGEPRERAQVAALLVRTLAFTGTTDEAIAIARRAAADAPGDLRDEQQTLQALELMAAFHGARDEEVLTPLRELRIDGDGPGAKMLAAITAFARALAGAQAAECVELAREALAGGVLIDADPALFPVVAIWTLVIADRDDALDRWAELRAVATRRGSLFGMQAVNVWGGATLLWRGELRDAEESLAAGLENLADWGLDPSSESYGLTRSFAGAVRLLRGDLDGARELLDPAQVEDRRTDGYRLLLSWRAELLLAERRHEEALAVAEELGDRFRYVRNPGWARWRGIRARALHGLGCSEEAIRCASDELELARQFGSPSVVGRALRVLGTLEGASGVERLREAVERLERSTAKLELALALFALGGTLRRGRRLTDARQPLRQALELADRCGADALADEVRTELYAAGGRPRRTALAGVDSLTASERRVAGLAAEGCTNKEIAQELYLTLKTVELHLSNAYRKLRIRSRRELPKALAAEAEAPKT
jgi:DNA-binding CsgD family transcriptional regulator/exonuclease VII small subunit